MKTAPDQLRRSKTIRGSACCSRDRERRRKNEHGEDRDVETSDLEKMAGASDAGTGDRDPFEGTNRSVCAGADATLKKQENETMSWSETRRFRRERTFASLACQITKAAMKMSITQQQALYTALKMKVGLIAVAAVPCSGETTDRNEREPKVSTSKGTRRRGIEHGTRTHRSSSTGILPGEEDKKSSDQTDEPQKKRKQRRTMDVIPMTSQIKTAVQMVACTVLSTNGLEVRAEDAKQRIRPVAKIWELSRRKKRSQIGSDAKRTLESRRRTTQS